MALELGPVIGTVGGGGGVEEIPVSMSGGGGATSAPTVYPLTTVDAGDGRFIVVTGMMVPTSESRSDRPHLQIGNYVHEEPHVHLQGDGEGFRICAFVTGTVEVSVLSRRLLGVTTFDGTVYVAHL